MIYSCRDCVAPKRHPGCHSSCPDYLAEKAEYDRKKAISDQQKAVHIGLTTQNMRRISKVQKAMRKLKRR